MLEYLKIENLAVLETAPTVSRLDIFWETSTSGLLSDLNTAISEGTTGAVAIDDFNFVLKLLNNDKYSKSKIFDLRIPNRVITYD